MSVTEQLRQGRAETNFHNLPGSPTSRVLSFHNTFFLFLFYLKLSEWHVWEWSVLDQTRSASFILKCMFFFSFTIMCFLPFSSDGLLMCSCLLTWIIPVKPSAFNSWSGFSLNQARSLDVMWTNWTAGSGSDVKGQRNAAVVKGQFTSKSQPGYWRWSKHLLEKQTCIYSDIDKRLAYWANDAS